MPGVRRGRLELEEQLVRLDPAVVVRLIVELHRERAHDLPREAIAADLHEELVHVVRGVLLVLGEDLDEVAEGLALELVELLALGDVALLRARTSLGDLEHADEALGRLLRASEAPHAPGALEHREAV